VRGGGPPGDPPVTDVAVIGRLLDEYHERSVPSADIQIVAGSVQEARISYELTLPDGSRQLIRAYRADGAVPVYGRGPFTETVRDWLLGRAETLDVLEASGYPAPRPVRTRTGELVAVAGPWLAWATTCVPGVVLAPTPDQLHALGSSLGRLHRVIAGGGGRRLASRHPAVAVPMMLARLDAVAGLLPADWVPMAAAFRQTVLAVAAGASAVRESVVHADVWARHAVQPVGSVGPAGAVAGPVVLIDWESGGLGLSVLDLGNCLLECHLDAALAGMDPQAWLISPAGDRIEAVARGYAAVRRLSAAELSLLPDAVRFTAAVDGAIHFELALSDGVTGPVMDARLAGIQRRMEVADEVAALAAPHLG
jgi:Ser/Thr protein kinase RdoA (MazF antagonist)